MIWPEALKAFFSDEPETKQPQPNDTTGQQLAKQTSMAESSIVTNWGGIGSWFSGLWEGIKNTFSGGWELVKKLFSFSPLGLVIKAWQPMLNWVSEKMGWISDLAGGIKSFFSDEPETKQPQPNDTTGQQLAKQTSMAESSIVTNWGGIGVLVQWVMGRH